MRTDFTAEEQSLQEREVRRNHTENAPVDREARENDLPKDKRKALKRIVGDKTEPHHIRSEAQRILDIGDVMSVAEFAYRYAEFIDSYTAPAS